jgi:hypothetical protein
MGIEMWSLGSACVGVALKVGPLALWRGFL